MFQTVVDHRRALHRIPELDNQLPETVSYVRSVLEPLGCALSSPIPGSVCVFFDAGKPESVAFRADMDALPVTEATGLSYASTHPGKMHACGHDGHTAMALALAEYVSAHLSELPRNVLFLFQPAEETTGGAKLVCESGVFEKYRCDRIFGWHLWPDLPAGTIASRPGPLLARSSEVTVTVTGKSSHVAKPHEGRDALFAASAFLYESYRLIELLGQPEEPRLLKFGKLTSGQARNAISDSSLLLGTLRVYSDEMFTATEAMLRDLVGTIERKTGCRFEIAFSAGYPPVRNDPTLFETARAALPQLQVLENPLMISEDFSFYQQRLPGLFLLLGTGTGIPLHADTFDFDESVLAAGLAADELLLFLN